MVQVWVQAFTRAPKTSTRAPCHNPTNWDNRNLRNEYDVLAHADTGAWAPSERHPLDDLTYDVTWLFGRGPRRRRHLRPQDPGGRQAEIGAPQRLVTYAR